jgi:hypothetical protein
MRVVLMRLGVGVGGRGAGPIASAVRSPAAAWVLSAMGPSRSRAARSRTPRRCVRARYVCTSHFACCKDDVLRAVECR